MHLLQSETNTFHARFVSNRSQREKSSEAEVNGWVGAPFTPIILSEHDGRRGFQECGHQESSAEHLVMVMLTIHGNTTCVFFIRIYL